MESINETDSFQGIYKILEFTENVLLTPVWCYGIGQDTHDRRKIIKCFGGYWYIY